jgi:hypothetical protein
LDHREHTHLKIQTKISTCGFRTGLEPTIFCMATCHPEHTAPLRGLNIALGVFGTLDRDSSAAGEFGR